MRDLVHRYLGRSLSRRGFVKSMGALGFSAAAAQAVLAPLDASERAASTDVAGASTVEGTGGDLVVAQAKAAGVEYLFTNPGSYEVGFFDAFVDTPGMQLIMGLHEGVVISMADGYHRVSRKPALVNVHVIAGTAQAAGQIYNAARDGSALVITAGLNDNEQWSDDILLAPRPGFDQKEINRQFTKISWEARKPESLALMVRRAFKVAATEPGGPVYLAMAHYALEAKGVRAQVLPAERFLIRARVRATASDVQEAARMLAEARRPILVVGDEVWKSGAQAELVAFSEKLGLPVAAGLEGFSNFPVRHPHCLGGFSMGSEYVKRGVDLVVVIGARDFGGRAVPESPEAPPGARILRIGIDTNNMGRNYPTDLALVSDVKEALVDLRAALESRLTKERLAALAAPRSEEIRAITTARRAKAEADARKNFGRRPIHPDELGAVMARTIDPDAIVVTENLTGRYDAFRFGFRENELMRVANTGASLGWGIGASIGAKLAAPDRQVVCSIGDGSVMYSASGFWTQARYGIPVLTVVWNNYNYQTVRFAYHNYKRKMAGTGHYAGMYLGDPEIDFVKLAASQGVAGEKVTAPGEIEPALKRGIAATRDGRPYLVEAVIARYGGGAESTWHQKFNLAERRKRRA
ncbi:MAG TPA: thiamine pyrophosphate-binding protein [Bryobacterales bacterium]|nr:thiamine pyrophosphate-binding protein [Bryobacterales bacterium]